MQTMTPADFEWYYGTSYIRFDVYDLKIRDGRFVIESMWGDEPPELEVATVANLQTSDPRPRGAALVGTNIRPGYDLGLFRLGDRLFLRPTASWTTHGEIEWVDAAHSCRVIG
jgi:hypothetical protein